MAQAAKAPRVPWRKFLEMMEFKPGQHSLIIARSGSGKTVLVQALAMTRPWSVVVVTKPADSSTEWLRDTQGFKVARTWADTEAGFFRNRRHGHWILWPSATSFDSKDHQRAVLHDAFVSVWEERNWSLALDEAQLIHQHLSLGPDLAQMFLQGRSLGISLIASSQRPFNLGREAATQAVHFFFLRSTDTADLDRLQEIVGRTNAEMVYEIVPKLDKHEFLYLNVETGVTLRSRVPADLAP